MSSPDPTWSGQASTDGSETALSPESRHSNGSAIGLAGSPVVQSFGYGPGPGRAGGLPGYVMAQSRMMSPASATGPPLVAGQPATAWVPTSAGGYIIQSPTAAINPIEVFPLSSPGRSPVSTCEKQSSEFMFQLTRTPAWCPACRDSHSARDTTGPTRHTQHTTQPLSLSRDHLDTRW